MSKTILVALREFHENLRTKTFWLGILVFPVILILSFVVPSWLEEQKEVRVYSVLDRTGWLADETLARADSPDIERLFDVVAKEYSDGKPNEEWPPMLKAMAPQLAQMKAKDRRQLAWSFVNWDRIKATLSPELLDRIPQAERKKFEDGLAQLKSWWSNLDSEAARKELGAFDLSKQSYEFRDFRSDDLSHEQLKELLDEKLEDGEIFAYFEMGGDPVKGEPELNYWSSNLTDGALRSWFEGHANTAVQARRFIAENVDPSVVEKIQARISFTKKTVDSETGEATEVTDQQQARSFMPVAFVYLLWITTFMMAQMLLTNTIEEKSNRTIEVLLSSVSPIQLMSGKIAGIAATGLTLIVSWIAFFFLIVKFALPAMGVDAPFDLTPLLTDPIYLGSFVAYFVLGFLLYAALIAGVGSVCNSLKEAQNLMMPISVFLMLPLFAMVPVVQDPNGILARVLSYVPPLTPFIMMNRAALPPTPFEYVVTTLILLLSIAFTFYAAAKVFRIGILMTGKPPKVGEILRWIKAPVGAIPDTEHD